MAGWSDGKFDILAVGLEQSWNMGDVRLYGCKVPSMSIYSIVYNGIDSISIVHNITAHSHLRSENEGSPHCPLPLLRGVAMIAVR